MESFRGEVENESRDKFERLERSVEAIRERSYVPIADGKVELDSGLVVIHQDMKMALRRAEQGMKSSKEKAGIDTSTTEMRRLSKEVERLTKPRKKKGPHAPRPRYPASDDRNLVNRSSFNDRSFDPGYC